MSTDDKICLARHQSYGAVHVCHEDQGHAGDHICKSCGDRWAGLIEPPSLVDAVHEVDVAAARAAGWREAIEALRDEAGFAFWVESLTDEAWAALCGRGDVGIDSAPIAADYLESLAPKETP